jgi:hypothetical protein
LHVQVSEETCQTNKNLKTHSGQFWLLYGDIASISLALKGYHNIAAFILTFSEF